MDSMLASVSTSVTRGSVVSRRVAVGSGLLAVACVLGLIEAAMPGLPLAPWLKLGLANIAVVVALAVADGATAAVVSLGRVVIVGLATGTLGTPVGLIAAAGAIASLGVMWALSSRGDAFSLVGWSAAGSAAHVLAQLVIAGPLVGSWSLMALAPASVLIALPLGALTGYLARTIVSRLTER
ncbi:Gx transporter family protein [Anaerosoma tenue]|uniref:Gx transporter family protein n=1 Tax=Anaerosoma tenue TaxID=2933588 RepID=UPI002260A765|nr:Gx transporter family protein [Anaerosoma tenue]MCK8114018.1 Gx transporter family protein [Anaerosoma tenue]